MNWRDEVAKLVQAVRDDVQELVDNSNIDNKISDGLHKVADTIDVVADKVSDLFDEVAEKVVLDKEPAKESANPDKADGKPAGKAKEASK